MLPVKAGGGYAEYALVSETMAAPAPAGITLAEAASVPLAALTALQSLRDKAGVSDGCEVLVYGASGGVGSFAVQVAKSLGGRVTAAASGRNAEFVRALGADEVVDYHARDRSPRPAVRCGVRRRRQTAVPAQPSAVAAARRCGDDQPSRGVVGPELSGLPPGRPPAPVGVRRATRNRSGTPRGLDRRGTYPAARRAIIPVDRGGRRAAAQRGGPGPRQISPHRERATRGPAASVRRTR